MIEHKRYTDSQARPKSFDCFTLIELLITIAIMVVVLFVVIRRQLAIKQILAKRLEETAELDRQLAILNERALATETEKKRQLQETEAQKTSLRDERDKLRADLEALQTKNRSRSVAPQSGICARCVDGCKGNCDLFQSTFRGRELLYPSPFGKVTAGADKDYPVDYSHLNIMGYALGAKGHFHCLDAASGEIIWQKAKSAGGSCAWGSFRTATNPVPVSDASIPSATRSVMLQSSSGAVRDSARPGSGKRARRSVHRAAPPRP